MAPKHSRMPIGDLRLLALCELSTNESITTYTMENGVEVRRIANPWAALKSATDKIAKAFEAMPTERIVNAFSELAKGIRDGRADQGPRQT